MGKNNKNVSIKIKDISKNKIIYEDFGEMLFTHFGVSGPTILSSSAHLLRYKNVEELLKENNWLQSMSRRGNCWDNAPQESFYGHMKDEIDISNCKNFDDIKLIIDDYMDYYNNERYQWNLAKLSPNEYYEYLTTGIYPLKNDNRNN